MPDPTPTPPLPLDRVLLLALAAIFLLVSPIREWWAADDALWYSPYLLWAVIIFLAWRRARAEEAR